jgi:flavin reductase (DIM6/NTAB) family NADH-FMN oxidoreductase RutF
MQGFNSITPGELNGNIFRMIGDQWMLIGAGSVEKHNMMTASWGAAGILWNKPVAVIFIRPSRFTYQFIEKDGMFTLNFFGESRRDTLNFCGSRSGRDVNKTRECGLTPLVTESGAVGFAEAELVMECKKIYFNDLVPGNFIDPSIEKNYNGKDYHRMYIAEILRVHIK